MNGDEILNDLSSREVIKTIFTCISFLGFPLNFNMFAKYLHSFFTSIMLHTLNKRTRRTHFVSCLCVRLS